MTMPSLGEASGSHDADLLRLHELCTNLEDGSNSEQENSRHQLTEAILQLLVTEDMSSIRDSKVLNSLFVNYLHLLPHKVISEILSVLIAIVKKSVFYLESTRGLLIPCIKHLLAEHNNNNQQISSNATPAIDNNDNSNDSSKQSFTTSSSSSIDSGVSLTKHFLREWVNLLIAHSCDVEELKSILQSSEREPTLLNFIQQANLKQRNRPPAFFAFPGTKGSMMSLPPFQKWPIQTGWSFSTWFFLEPKSCAQPYLYNFKTGKSGLGYSAHFTGSCLVLTSIRVKGKGVQHCVAYEFPSYKWIHCAITYHNKWRSSEIKVYVNGQQSANIEMPWQVQTTEIFDKCFIGGSGSLTSNDRGGDLNCFCGQMAAVYLFNEGLSAAQICAIHRLGASYMGQFKYSNESNSNLPPQVSKILYEEKLSSLSFCLFTPVAVDSGTLCIQLAPFKSSTSPPAQNFFISAPHAALAGQTKAIITQPICSTLQSLGFSSSLLPLLEAFAKSGKPEACASLIGFLCDLLESSPHWFANEIVQNNGFVIVACTLAADAKLLITDKLLEIFLNLTRSLLTSSTTIGDSLLLKHLMDNILFNYSLWIYADTKLQRRLYCYLASEFLHGTRQNPNKYTITNSTSSGSSSYVAYSPTSSVPLPPMTNDEQQRSSQPGDGPSPAIADLLFGEIRRVSTVLQSLHALKYFYWINEEKGIIPKARNQQLRPTSDQLASIRSDILLFTKELIMRASSAPLDEIQGILNYLSSCSCEENLLDVMQMVASLLNERPNAMVAALEQKQGVRVIFELLESKSQAVCVGALRMLSLFLSHCSNKKKQEIMGPNNLFTLLYDKLKRHKPMTSAVYEALMDIMVERELSSDLVGRQDKQSAYPSSRELSKMRIENSALVKVIASLLHDERNNPVPSSSLPAEPSTSDNHIDLRSRFINDLWNLVVNSKENRRIILQMSVWQHWLINLLASTISDPQLMREQILSIFRVLLYHAIRYEYGGWRVWIDTLAIIHTKVSYDEFNQQLTKSELGERQSPEPLSQMPCESDREQSCGKLSPSSNAADGLDQPVVSSISERIHRETSQTAEESAVSKVTKIGDQLQEVDLNSNCDDSCAEQGTKSEIEKRDSMDTVDLAPSRAYRQQTVSSSSPTNEEPQIEGQASTGGSQGSESPAGMTRHQSLTSIPLEGTSNEGSVNLEMEPEDGLGEKSKEPTPDKRASSTKGLSALTKEHKATASPAFRIPEFRWGPVLIKLLNDLMFSIECDLYQWRVMAKCANIDAAPFEPKSIAAQTAGPSAASGPAQSSAKSSAAASSPSMAAAMQVDQVMRRPENQVYITNVVHFVSQLADNIIIAAGGLLPLLAEATGGSRNSSTGSGTTSNAGAWRAADREKLNSVHEGLSLAQANSLLYRLANMVDMAVYAAPHINLNELEADKNTTSGGILRQCLRLACTVTVKNCLLVKTMLRAAGERPNSSPEECFAELERANFNSYLGCSLLSSNGLFQDSALSSTDQTSDLVASLEFSPHQTPNSRQEPSLLPFQPTPIQDPDKLLQRLDISRVQAAIYHEYSVESRHAQFLALSSLYFISVLMVSKYRDIIEPKQQQQQRARQQPSGKTPAESPGNKSEPEVGTLTDLLTAKLETTLDSVCPLLKTIMCDFCTFLSKTLVGSHGQDLVNKEAERTFSRESTSPVELVMLLCSQEWQNTLQKNAGLAFIELINEGRVLSHGMKDHIVRVAMEAEFILSRLRADDVAKHQLFMAQCQESHASRLHEELLINSLISSAARRDHLIYCKFLDAKSSAKPAIRHFKLDTWEDDDRRRRRFLRDPLDDRHQLVYRLTAGGGASGNGQAGGSEEPAAQSARRMLELQHTIELGGLHEQISQAATSGHHEEELRAESLDVELDGPGPSRQADDDDESPDEDHDEAAHKNDSALSQDSDCNEDLGSPRLQAAVQRSTARARDVDQQQQLATEDSGSPANGEPSRDRDYEDCAAMGDFTGSVLYATGCSLIWSIYSIPGLLQITSHELYFEPSQNLAELIDQLKRGVGGEQLPTSGQLRHLDLRVLCYCDFLASNGKVPLSEIRAVFSRHHLLQPLALEIFLAQRSSVMFAFPDFDSLMRVVRHLPPVGVGIKYGIPQTRRASLMSPRQLFQASDMTRKWQRREIGNFQYLMFLNTIAGRTYQDLNQYPVFPWILTNYESAELDLTLPSNFRDLSKPVGALNAKRRQESIERYQSWDNPKVPAFHYGTHYSTAAFTLNWLCRLRGAPNCAYLALQDGAYEEVSRLFMSIQDSWLATLGGSHQNVKELIPEFFYLPEMLHGNLGLPAVELPPWAKSSEQFARLHRLALESELVSCQLHQWIDLIFGYKQRGPEAVTALNTFYYLTYQGNVNLSMIQEPALREAIESQIKHFGQTPGQLTTEPHPPRFSALHASPMAFSPTLDELNKVIKFPFNAPIVYISPCIKNTMSSGPLANQPSSAESSSSTGTVAASPQANQPPSSLLTITSNNQYQIHKWAPADQTGRPFVIDPQLEQVGSHAPRRQLIDVDDLCPSIALRLASLEPCQVAAPSASETPDEVRWPCAHYITTIDGRYIIMGSFYDNSFRVFATESGKLCQVIYGHRAPITCITRSDGNAAADFYVAIGSQDCSLLLWAWNDKYAQIEGSGVSAVHNPLPKLTISGHQSPVLSCLICAELGLIVSGSKNLILVHTTTSGESILEIEVSVPHIFEEAANAEGCSQATPLERPTLGDKQRATLEASMLGDHKGPVARQAPASGDSSPRPQRFPHLREVCAGDYYITNLQLSRELAFIVCVALPPPRLKRSAKSASDESAKSSSAALLMTFNLRGTLMECTTIGQAASGPRLGATIAMVSTRDGEHIILNDGPTSLKIYRTFDLQPIYAYNTNDISTNPADDQNKVRTLALLDNRFILVGLENGKIVIYNADFRSSH